MSDHIFKIPGTDKTITLTSDLVRTITKASSPFKPSFKNLVGQLYGTKEVDVGCVVNNFSTLKNVSVIQSRELIFDFELFINEKTTKETDTNKLLGVWTFSPLSKPGLSQDTILNLKNYLGYLEEVNCGFIFIVVTPFRRNGGFELYHIDVVEGVMGEPIELGRI